jgi:hypothetical protein|tara:strand:+ start:3187 stop:3435 length:249 start_codon:yes stop_codon:yes gene_type:complete
MKRAEAAARSPSVLKVEVAGGAVALTRRPSVSAAWTLRLGPQDGGAGTAAMLEETGKQRAGLIALRLACAMLASPNPALVRF